jgi:hypothetical protein
VLGKRKVTPSTPTPTPNNAFMAIDNTMYIERMEKGVGVGGEAEVDVVD